MVGLNKTSHKPRKILRRQLTAPKNRRLKWVRAPLSPELREHYGLRSVRVRVGDTVKVRTGSFRGVEGKVSKVLVDRGHIAVEGVTREKTRGGTVPYMLPASKVLVLGLNLDDRWRREKLEAKVSQR